MGDDSLANELDLSKYYQKTCLICFKTDKDTKELFDLWLADDERITMLDKLQSFARDTLWVSESSVLCNSCVKHLNDAFDFKTKLSNSQDVWKNASTTTSNKQIQKTDVPTSIDDSEATTDSLTYCESCDSYFINGSELSSEHKCPTAYGSAESESPQPGLRNFSTCELCGKKFKDISRKNSHTIKVHARQKLYTCTFCNKSFKQKYHLKEHLTSHTGEKNYPCVICNKIFQRMSSQRRHVKTHQRPPGEKTKQTPFLCTICGKTFPYSNGVQRHLRIHTGEKKYKCNVCDKQFAQTTHLQVHLRTHTGEKPYMCNFCGESFALNSALQKHIVNAHMTGDS